MIRFDHIKMEINAGADIQGQASETQMARLSDCARLSFKYNLFRKKSLSPLEYELLRQLDCLGLLAKFYNTSALDWLVLAASPLFPPTFPHLPFLPSPVHQTRLLPQTWKLSSSSAVSPIFSLGFPSLEEIEPFYETRIAPSCPKTHSPLTQHWGLFYINRFRYSSPTSHPHPPQASHRVLQQAHDPSSDWGTGQGMSFYCSLGNVLIVECVKGSCRCCGIVDERKGENGFGLSISIVWDERWRIRLRHLGFQHAPDSWLYKLKDINGTRMIWPQSPQPRVEIGYGVDHPQCIYYCAALCGFAFVCLFGARLDFLCTDHAVWLIQ